VKLGTIVKLPDGREGTMVYNSLIGVGIRWGRHYPDPADFEGSSGDTIRWKPPEDWPWEPDALLRDPWESCREHGFEPDECVGDRYEIVETPREDAK